MIEKLPPSMIGLTPEARYEDFKKNWGLIMEWGRSGVQAANSYASPLVTQFLIDGCQTILQNVLAPLKSFSRDFRTDPVKPRAIAQLKFVSGSDGVVQQNATNFESGDTTVAAIALVPTQFSRAFHVTDSELNSGLRMNDLLTINLAVFSDAILQAATAPITQANFPISPLVRPFPNFGWADMQSAWSALKKAPVKNAILDGEYFMQIMNIPTQFQETGTESGQSVWKKFGWDSVTMNTNWNGADANTRGFFCSPQAIGVMSGPPIGPLQGADNLSVTAFTVPGIEMVCHIYRWMNVQTRTLWYSFDVVFASSVIDGTAGVILKSQ